MFKCIRHYQHPPPPPFPHLSNVEIADGIRGNSMSHVFISAATQKIEHICVDQRRTISHGLLLSTLELGGRGSGRRTLSWHVSEWIPLFSPGDGPLKVMHPNKFNTILENMWFLSMQARLSAHVLPVNHLAAKQSSWEYHTMCAWFAGQNKSALIQLQHSMHWVCTDRALYIMKLWVDQSKPSCGNFWNTYSYKGKECIFYEIQCHLSNYHQSVQKSTDPGTDPL